MDGVERRVFVLSVGLEDVGRARSSAAREAFVDALGAWWVFDTYEAAREHAERVFDADAWSRVLIDHGVRLGGVPGVGPVCARMSDAALWLESGTCAVSVSCHEAMRILGLGSEEEVPLGRRGGLRGWVGARVDGLREASGVSWRARTNVRWSYGRPLGRQVELRTLDEVVGVKDVTHVRGGWGVGKTAVLGAWAREVLRADGRAHVWWVELDGVRATSALAERVAEVFGGALRGASPEGWLGTVSAACQARPGWRVVCVLEDIDALDAQARSWLERLMRACAEVEWVVSGASEWGGAREVQVGPLGLADGVRVLARRARMGRVVGRDLERLSHWARVCEGHPGSLSLLSLDALDAGGGFEGDAFVEDGAKGDEVWASVAPRAREELASSSVFEGAFTAEFAGVVLGRGVGEVTARARALERRGWLVREGEAWRMPGHVRRVVRERGDPEVMREAMWLMRRELEREAAAFVEGDEVAREEWMVRHEADLLRAFREGLEAEDERVYGLLWACRAHFNEHRFASVVYREALEQALELAGRRGWGEVEARTMLCLAQAMDTFEGEVDEVRRMFGEARARAGELTASERALLETVWGRFVHDGRRSEEEAEESLRVLDEAYALGVDAGDHVSAAKAASLRAEYTREPDEAKEWSRRAREEAVRSGAPSARVFAAFAAHRVAAGRGDWQAARASAQDALREAHVMQRPESMVMLLASLGFVAIQEGEGLAARRHLFEALSLSREVGYWFGETNCASLLGVAHMLDQEWDMARALLDRSWEMNARDETAWNMSQIDLFRACCLAALGSLEGAEEALARGRAYFEEFEGAHYLEVAECVEEALEVARAVGARDEVERLEEVGVRLGRFDGLGEVVVIVRRWLEARVEAARGQGMEPLRVESGGARIRPPGATEWVDLARKTSKRRIMVALLERRLESPGETLTAHDLFEVGWPGEHPDVRTGLMRVYVAINALRKLGLDGVLETFEEGYRLAPGLPVEWARV